MNRTSEHTDIKQNLAALHFKLLPDFAHYLLQAHLETFCLYKINLSRELDIPILKLFKHMSDTQLLEYTLESNKGYLTLLAQNNARSYIDDSRRKWITNTFPQIDKSAIVAEDITYVNYLQKKAFLQFIPQYCKDAAQMLELIDEIDLFLLEMETVFTNTYVNLLNEEINQSSHLLQNINNTLPGAAYVFDVVKFKGVYSNNKLASVIGYTQDELNALGENAVSTLIHPDDLAETTKHLQEVRIAADGEILTYKYRIKAKDGVYHWIRTYESPFKRQENGTISQIVGITLNIDKEQQLAEALAEREAQYKKAEALANMGHFNYNIASQTIEWTDQLYTIYGLEPQSEKILPDRFLTFVHPDDKDLVLKSLNHLMQEKKVNYTFRIITDTGEERTIKSVAELQCGENGIPLKIIGAEQDITEKQLLIEQLRQSEQLYKQAQALTHVGNWTWDVETGEVQWSEELYKIYEMPVSETPSYEKILSYVHPDDLDAVVSLLNQSIAQKTTYDKHHRIILPNGKIKTIHRRAEVQVKSDGFSLRLVGTTQDVTQQKFVEQELRDNQNFIKKIADASPTILYLFDVTENRFSYINHEIYYVLGYTTEEIESMGDAVTELLYHPDDIHLLPERKESHKGFQHTDSMMQYECRVKGKEGIWCWLLIREVIFKNDEDGNILQILGAALDITKRKEMEKTLLQNSFLLEQSNASLEEFAYVASHDLKEPLRKISTFGDRLMNTQLEKLTDDGKIYLKKIVDAAQRMQIMINDLLSISMISSDRSFETYSLQAVLDDVLQTMDYKIEQNSALIEADALPEARIVPSQFRQLFQNLISNSLKFVRVGVQPCISIRFQYLQQEDVQHLDNAKTYLKLEFRDNGIGFEEEYAGKIFAIFQRLHGRSEYEGTGIGLAICKKIVEHHGGIIYANGTTGQGATFTIILPTSLSASI